MIVQTAPEGQSHFVIEQHEHAKTSGRIAAKFGNNRFRLPDPQDAFLRMVENHDAGWVPVDAEVLIDDATGLPYHLTQTPLPKLIETSAGSPSINEAVHRYSGLLSSMHSYGLFHGRYGLSDFLFIDRIPDAERPAMEKMLAEELNRQSRLRLALATDPLTAAWANEAALFYAYKLLQFFDTLALYFQMSHAGGHGTTKFLNVPDINGVDKTLTISPSEDGTYLLDPWPFSTSKIRVNTLGRYISPADNSKTARQQFLAAQLAEQSFVLHSLEAQ
jgi:hypothetical protein